MARAAFQAFFQRIHIEFNRCEWGLAALAVVGGPDSARSIVVVLIAHVVQTVTVVLHDLSFRFECRSVVADFNTMLLRRAANAHLDRFDFVLLVFSGVVFMVDI